MLAFLKSSHFLGFVMDHSFSQFKTIMTFNLIEETLPIKDGSIFGEGIARPHLAWYLQTEEVLQGGWENHCNNQDDHTGCGLILVAEPRLCC